MKRTKQQETDRQEAIAQLHAGDIILRDGRLWRVGLLNTCRMRLDPLEGHEVTLTTPGGDTRTFQAYGRSENIAPSAEYPLATAEDVARVARRVQRLEMREP